MTEAEESSRRMPVAVRVAVSILSVITVLCAVPMLWLGLILAAYGGPWGVLLGLIPVAWLVAFAAVTILMMARRPWARYAAVLFPVSFVGAAVAMREWAEAMPVLISTAVLTLVAVAFVFAPSSRSYFVRLPAVAPLS